MRDGMSDCCPSVQLVIGCVEHLGIALARCKMAHLSQQDSAKMAHLLAESECVSTCERVVEYQILFPPCLTYN